MIEVHNSSTFRSVNIALIWYDSVTQTPIMANNTTVTNNGSLTESLEDLNKRFADALLPLTATFGVFAFAGFFGNLLILLVFSLSREYKKNNFKIFVLCLAIIDFITCITLIPAEMVKQRHYFAFDDVAACKVKCFFNVFGASASCLSLLIISIDRFRRAVQPMRKQLSPSLAIKLLVVFGFVIPILLSVPGTIMCGIEKANKTNIYGTDTEIYLCATEDKYKYSIWRIVYKYTFIILLVGISFVYIVLYTFVMREVAKQVRTMTAMDKNSSFEVCYSSDIYDPNSVQTVEENGNSRTRILSKTSFSDEDNLMTSLKESANGKQTKKEKSAKAFRQPSLKSIKSHFSSKSKISMFRRRQFPYKTIIWFILTLIFIITYITHLIFALRVEKVVVMSPREFSVYSFFFRIYFFNHFINPVVYAIFVERFRKSCRNLLPIIKQKLADAFYWYMKSGKMIKDMPFCEAL